MSVLPGSPAPSGTPASAHTGASVGVSACLVADKVGVELGGRRVLEDVDLMLESGRPVAVTGPSGSGKTVLCLVLAGALRPTRGRVWLVREGGGDVPEPRDASSGSGAGQAPGYLAGLVLQTHGLVSGLTAEENVALPLQARRVDRAEVATRTARALFDVGLEKHAARPVDELSGGERQRVGIARAIALDPTVLIADEPTSELDPDNRSRVIELLIGASATDRIVVVASDDPDVLSHFATIVFLDRGRLVDRTFDGGEQARR